jgi:hypothetical protein
LLLHFGRFLLGNNGDKVIFFQFPVFLCFPHFISPLQFLEWRIVVVLPVAIFRFLPE